MYHIKSDRRSQSSAAELARGLNQCLKTMPLTAVRIADLHRVTGISRATFYRLFDTIEDVLIYQLDQMLVRIQDACVQDSAATPYEAMRNLIILGFENTDVLESLVENRRFDLLYEYTAKRIFTLDTLRDTFSSGLSEAEAEYMVSNLAMSMVATLTTWIRRGRKETPDEVFQHNSRYWDKLRQIMNSHT